MMFTLELEKGDMVTIGLCHLPDVTQHCSLKSKTDLFVHIEIASSEVLHSVRLGT